MGIMPTVSTYIRKYGPNYWYEYQKAKRQFNLDMFEHLKKLKNDKVKR